MESVEDLPMYNPSSSTFKQYLEEVYESYSQDWDEEEKILKLALVLPAGKCTHVYLDLKPKHKKDYATVKARLIAKLDTPVDKKKYDDTELQPILDNPDTQPDKWSGRNSWFVYCSHFLSAWGDRMWSFGVGLFLVEIAHNTLQLAAIYGLCRGGAVLLFGAFVGDWVDKNPRLKAARVTLVLRNVCIIIGATAVCLLMLFPSQISSLWNGWLVTVCHGTLILFAVLAHLAAVGNTISIERDWVVEICSRDTTRLTTMTAIMRRIDLGTNILAPIATGQIIWLASLFYGAVFIAGWNLISVIVEYVLIKKVYDSFPALAHKKLTIETEIELDERSPEKTGLLSGEKSKPSCFNVLFSQVLILVNGWRVYMSYPVAWAGIGLGCLYMTVLGFDNITTGFAYSQGMSEALLGVMMGLGAIVGIAGTFFYPFLKRKVGLVRTGLFSMTAEVICLTLCIVSIWAPGSPFDILFRPPTSIPQNTTEPYRLHRMENETYMLLNETPQYISSTNSTPHAKSFISLGLLLAGIITARFGLWISDMTISQQILETVNEKERGIFAGVQASINMLMDLLKFAMVVACPYPELFGILVLISFAFIVFGALFYSYYSWKLRDHILPFHGLCTGSDRASKRRPATQ